MIASGYTLDLYCDREGDCPNNAVRFKPGSDSISHEERAACWREARRRGWKLNRAKGTALCPLCSGKAA